MRRIMGTETEYGIVDGNAHDVVSAYKDKNKHKNLGPTNKSVVEGFHDIGGHIGGDYGSIEEQLAEAYGVDVPVRPSLISRVGKGISNTISRFVSFDVGSVLNNGARFYVDMGHPEYSTPEVSNARDLVVVDKAGERIVDIAAKKAGKGIKIYKNNSDGNGNSFGCHENYLMSRISSEGFKDDLTPLLASFFATRQIFTGSGKIGLEEESTFGYSKGYFGSDNNSSMSYQLAFGRVLDALEGLERHFLDMPDIEEVRKTLDHFARKRKEVGVQQIYQLSQRADFFTQLIGLGTTSDRPIVNTRDEPHASGKYMRLHVISGDANMCEIANYLKAGTMALVLDSIEDGIIPDVKLKNPVKSFKGVSTDLSRKWNVKLDDGRNSTAVEVQRRFLDSAKNYSGRDEITDDVLRRWETTLDALETDPMQLMGKVDWVTKLGLLTSLMDRNGVGLNDAKIKNAALQYHDVDRKTGLYYYMQGKGLIERITTDEEIERAISNPPSDTRAYLRGKAADLDFVSSLDWGGFEVDNGRHGRFDVRMDEPFAGTKKQIGHVFDQKVTSQSLLRGIAQVKGISVGKHVIYTAPKKKKSKKKNTLFEEMQGGSE